jgi:hypothetical protein
MLSVPTMNTNDLFSLSGRIEAEQLRELDGHRKAEADGQSKFIDLKDVKLVNCDVVKYLKRYGRPAGTWPVRQDTGNLVTQS